MTGTGAEEGGRGGGGGVFHPCGVHSTLLANNIVSSTLLTDTMNANCFL
jgi:hypothetical protein